MKFQFKTRWVRIWRIIWPGLCDQHWNNFIKNQINVSEDSAETEYIPGCFGSQATYFWVYILSLINCLILKSCLLILNIHFIAYEIGVFTMVAIAFWYKKMSSYKPCDETVSTQLVFPLFMLSVRMGGWFLKTSRGKDWMHERVRDLRNETDLEVQRLDSSSDMLGGLVYKWISNYREEKKSVLGKRTEMTLLETVSLFIYSNIKLSLFKLWLMLCSYQPFIPLKIFWN